MHLPTSWHTVELSTDSGGDPTEAIYGIVDNNNSYDIYITNFHHVWREQVNDTQFLTKAASFGLEDLDTIASRELLQLLRKAVGNATTDDFTLRNNEVVLSVSTRDVKWRFSMAKMAESQSVRFFAQLNQRQLTNHAVLLQKISQLYHIIDIKDTYTKFLVENFKLSHGLDLITSYRRNNKHELEGLEPFSEDKWLNKFVFTNNEIGRAIADTHTWSAQPREKVPEEVPRKRSPFYTSPIKKDKKETILDQHETKPIKESNVKRSAKESTPERPPKRKRYGAIKNRSK